jgi:hypothetical protein
MIAQTFQAHHYTSMLYMPTWIEQSHPNDANPWIFQMRHHLIQPVRADWSGVVVQKQELLMCG